MRKTDKFARALLDKKIRGSTRLKLSDDSLLTQGEVMSWLSKEGYESLDARTGDGYCPLHTASSRGRLGIVHWLLKSGATVDVRTAVSSFTPLHFAAIRNNLRTAKWLVTEAQAQTDASSAGHTTVIMCAAHVGNVELMKFLLSKGASLTQNVYSKPIIAVAAARGHLSAVKWLHTQGCELDLVSPRGTTAIQYAAQGGHKHVVKWLAAHGCDIQRSNKNGDSALTLAAEKGRLKVVQWLVKHGAAIDHCNQAAGSPISVAAANGHLAVIEYLATHGSPMEFPDHSPSSRSIALSNAARSGHLEVLRWLIGQGLDPAGSSTPDCSPLRWACERGHLPLTQFLVDECHLSLDIRLSCGRTLAMVAAAGGHLNILRFMYLKDPSLLLDLDSSGSSAICYALDASHFAIVRWLVTHGCSIGGPRGSDSAEVLHTAVARADVSLLEFLFQSGSPISCTDQHGCSVIFLAIRLRRFPALKWLVSNGAPLDVRSPSGNTPLMVAANVGNFDIFSWLLSKGCTTLGSNDMDRSLWDIIGRSSHIFRSHCQRIGIWSPPVAASSS